MLISWYYWVIYPLSALLSPLQYEEVRGELQCVQRELQGAREEVQAGAGAQERLSQDLQVKQAQVCSLEGQLGSARTLTHTLEKEVKRLVAAATCVLN